HVSSPPRPRKPAWTPPGVSAVPKEQDQRDRVEIRAPDEKWSVRNGARHCDRQNRRIQDMGGHRVRRDPRDDLKLPALKQRKWCLHASLGGWCGKQLDLEQSALS